MNKQGSTVIEGFQGRMAIWMSGIFFIIGGIAFFQLRAFIHGTDGTVDFDNALLWIGNGLIVMVFVLPIIHQAIHAITAIGLGSGMKLFFGRIYPRVRPAKPLSVSAARIFLLAPQVLTLLCLAGVFIGSIAVASAFIGTVNIALSTNDLWKSIGLKQVEPTAQLQFHRDYCAVVDNKG